MICPNCNKKIYQNDNFCVYCGLRIMRKKEEGTYPNVPKQYRVEHIGVVNRDRDEGNKVRRGAGFRKGIKSILNYVSKNLLWVIAIIVLIFVALYLDNDNSSSSIPYNQAGVRIETEDFSELKEPKIITFQWEYESENYSITETLYKTAFEYYRFGYAMAASAVIFLIPLILIVIALGFIRKRLQD